MTLANSLDVLYDGKWWLGPIRDTCKEGDVLVAFTHPHGPAYLIHWPQKEDVNHVPL